MSKEYYYHLRLDVNFKTTLAGGNPELFKELSELVVAIANKIDKEHPQVDVFVDKSEGGMMR